jgi:hypothetical protein
MRDESGNRKAANEMIIRKLSRVAVLLPALLLFELVIALTMGIRPPFGAQTPEYLLPAREFAAHGRIASDFLPIGYSAILGIGIRLLHSQAGVTAINLVLYLALFAAAWWFLAMRGATTLQCLAVTLVLTLHPNVFYGIHKESDDTLIALLLFLFMAETLWILRAPHIGKDLLLGILLGCTAAVRPNLLLLIPVTWVLFIRFRLPRRWTRIVAQAVVAAGVYAGLTMAVHGTPFWPQNGPYNLLAGANHYSLAYGDQFEETLPLVLSDHGIHAGVDWDADPDRPGVTDLRNANLRSRYTGWALEYLRAHPAALLELPLMRALMFLRPELRVHTPNTMGGKLKILLALILPAWFLGLWVLPRPVYRPAAWVVPCVAVAYMLPFVLLIAAPRFRVPLELICLVDLGAMVADRIARQPDSPSVYLPSSPRPAA